jgi:polysaccharide deacetylase family protein (PEP-CTERM system associated)
MLNALTFDIEEYFQVEAFKTFVGFDDWDGFPSRVTPQTDRLLDLLASRGVTATFFVLGWIAERHSALLQRIHECGHEVACHGQAHQVISAMTPDEVRADVRRAKQTIEDAIGAPIFGYRAPTFSVVRQTLWALEILAEEGFTYDSSIFPIHHDRYGIADAYRFPHQIQLNGGGSIVEFPLTTVAFAGQRLPFSGGGYFRLLPYAAIRAGLRHLNRREKQPAIVYIHPWEIDPDQPRLPVRGLNRFRHYVNLRAMAGKLERLLDDFSFGPARDVLNAYDPMVVPR